MDFLDSKFMEDLKNGKLPAVTIDTMTIAKLGIMMFGVGAALIVLYQTLKNSK